ncbi:MAG: DEAD/DEAH box helicase family protein [Chitinophagaceae bacterium]|nr:DEAD/DEAH box helicase family protein [Chitinophagaceae bacterium]
MKLQFDSSQDYQLQAVQTVIDIFEGQPLNKGNFEVSYAMDGASIAFTEKGVGNRLVLSEEQLFANVQKLQVKNNIKQSNKIEVCTYLKSETESVSFPNHFTVEMETGTGKTYTYLRTIYELNKVYGFKKFVIVVPSVAIREGAVKNLEITHEHFQMLYGNQPVNFTMYDSTKLGTLRNFATANAIQILVINIDSFAKDTNVINTMRETGVKPIEYIQSTKPIVIVDEPQNMETEIRKSAIHNLNPLCTIRYSATHRNFYNLVYSLNPVQAYDLGLVKQIEVDGITTENNFTNVFIEFKGIQASKRKLKAKLNIQVNDSNGVQIKSVIANLGDDLYYLSNKRECYKKGFSVEGLDLKKEEVRFYNNLILRKGQSQGGLTDEVMKFQIERTIKWHLEKEQKLKEKGIKVLSLFFIDKVENYRKYDHEGKPQKGKFALWFEELYEQQANLAGFENPQGFSVEQLHNGYFSQDKGKFKDTKGNTNADNDTYSLIMKDKEKLLSEEEPLRFIFSHSALREGWDNPNVFQICTLSEAKSEIRKRQEIGRGLRLPVDNFGQRVWDKKINLLTVVANESYIDFSKQLQKEIEEETSVDFSGRIKNAREKAKIKLSKELTIENSPIFFEILERIKQRTVYNVQYTTNNLIAKAVEEIKQMPITIRPKLVAEKHTINITKDGLENKLQTTERKEIDDIQYTIPDVYGYIQTHIDITRNTIFEILKQSERYGELLINPQLFLDNVVQSIKLALNKLLIDGIKYEKVNGSFYEMQLFNSEEIETYLTDLFEVTRTDKTLFNYVPIDSNIESQFARDCEAEESVKFFFKLPRAFKIPTPIGNYVPDWAVIFHNDKKIYFVVETKGTLNRDLLREVEKMKIECGKKHFALFKPEGVEYKQAVKVADLH